MMNIVYLLLGSNLNDPRSNLAEARKHIRLKVGAIQQKSSLYQTAAWGIEDQPDFLNQVLIIHTTHDAPQILTRILAIEQEMGRVRTIKNASRIIDIDILFHNDAIINLANLQIPHPAIAMRRFVLTPLNEISPAYVHPSLGKSMTQLLTECSDQLEVKKI